MCKEKYRLAYSTSKDVLSKKEKTLRLLKEHIEIFRCPVCHAAININENLDIRCKYKHNFDLARQGYMNLLHGKTNLQYNKVLFLSRREMVANDFFKPLIKRICEIIYEEIDQTKRMVTIADAGCGEGSHLTSVLQELDRVSGIACSLSQIVGLGIDISKEAIKLATQHDSQTIWCVGDLANCPIADHRINVLLNILSPANYNEFQRITAYNGLILKTIPGEDYLKELREQVFDRTVKSRYSNKETVLLFQRQFKDATMFRVNYQVSVNKQLFEPLLRMTPLLWGLGTKEHQSVMGHLSMPEKVTMDFNVLIGRNS